MHVRMPVVTAKERWGQLVRRARIGSAVERVGEVIRILLVQTLEREAGKAGGGRDPLVECYIVTL